MAAFSGLQFGDPKIKLTRRLVNTLLLLLLFRILADVPVLNVDEPRIQHLLADNPLIGTIDLFAGGDVMAHFSVVAAGIFPYLLALILVQLITVVSPRLRELQRGEAGKARLERITKALTIPIAFFFAWTLSHYLSQQVGLFPGQIHWFTEASFWPSFRVICLITLGSMISTAVTELITRKGIGRGTEVVLVAGSSLVFVKQLSTVIRSAPSRVVGMEHLAWVMVGSAVVVVLSIYVMGSERDIPIEYAKRVVGRRLMAGSKPHLPLLLNYGRIFPVSAAIGVLSLLGLVYGFFQSHSQTSLGSFGASITAWATPATGWYWLALACLIVFFTYVYNFSLLWDGDTPIADNLKKAGAFIPGVRPGQRTQDYISQVVRNITPPGALGLALLSAGLPYAVLRLTHQNLMVTVLSLIVVVITVQALRNEANAYHLAEAYEGFSHPSPKSRLWGLLG